MSEDQPNSGTTESYIQKDNPAFEAQLTRRTAEREASFFLPHLRAGMDLLDVGCGPATITIGLAETVAPGQVVGIDRDPGQIERSRAFAAERGLTNIRFEVADVYELPFPDASFDAAFAHVILMHLSDPVRALKEIRRVLRPGGVIGMRDPDLGTFIREPSSPMSEEFRRLQFRVQEFGGGNFLFGRTHRSALLEAGFARAEAGASVRAAGSLETCLEIAGFLKSQVPGVGRTALAEGWTDQATLDAIVEAFDEWAARPDAFYACTFCHAVGWVSE
jgi:ubiquinone/menaquinone biosynthesis C-methylase UbiE